MTDFLSSEPVRALGWTLLHSLWLITLAALLFWVILRFLSNRSPNLRYAVACTGLALMCALPVATFLTTQGDPITPVSSVPVTSAEPSSPIVMPSPSHSIILTDTSPQPAWPAWFVFFWTLGVLFFSLRNLGGWITAHRWKQRMARPATADLYARMKKIALKTGVTRAVRLRISHLLSSPITLGCFRPTILLPAGLLTGISPLQLEAILAHELAHIRRHDYLAGLLQAAAETLFFYHPGVWWISRIIRKEREFCCDDAAARISDPMEYARALSSLTENRIASSPALSASGEKGSSLERVQRILGKKPMASPKKKIHPRSLLVILAVPMALLFLLLSQPGSGLAGTDDKPASSPKEKKDSPIKDEKKIQDANRKIAEKLRTVKIDLDMTETPLNTFGVYLKEVTGIPFRIDPSVDPDKLRINVKLKDAVLAEALKLAISVNQMTYVVQNGMVVFTRKEKAKPRKKTTPSDKKKTSPHPEPDSPGQDEKKIQENATMQLENLKAFLALQETKNWQMALELDRYQTRLAAVTKEKTAAVKELHRARKLAEELSKDLSTMKKYIELKKAVPLPKEPPPKKNPEPLPNKPDKPEKPDMPVHGRVQAVANDIGVVVLSVGRDQGVKVGEQFIICRGSAKGDIYVAKMEIDTTEQNYSYGRIVHKRLDLRVGDKASNHILNSSKAK